MVLLPGVGLACNDGYGRLDQHNAQLGPVLGITFSGATIKASSMNGQCWLDDVFEPNVLRALWLGEPPDKGTSRVLTVPAIRVEPDYATYTDADDAYEFGRKVPLGHNTFALAIAHKTPETLDNIRTSFARPGAGTKTDKIGTLTSNSASLTVDGIEVEVFTTTTKGGILSTTLYQSAAIFTAPMRPDLLVLLTGHANSEADHVAGINVEETFHQALRQMERPRESELTCPFDFDDIRDFGDITSEYLGFQFMISMISRDLMGSACWGPRYDNPELAALLASGGTPQGVETMAEIAALDPRGHDEGQVAFKISVSPWDVYLANRDELIRIGLMRPVATEQDEVEHRHRQVTVNGVPADIFTAYVDAPFLKTDSYLSGAVLQSPHRPDLAVILRGSQTAGWDRLDGALIEHSLHDVLAGMSPTK